MGEVPLCRCAVVQLYSCLVVHLVVWWYQRGALFRMSEVPLQRSEQQPPEMSRVRNRCRGHSQTRTSTAPTCRVVLCSPDFPYERAPWRCVSSSASNPSKNDPPGKDGGLTGQGHAAPFQRATFCSARRGHDLQVNTDFFLTAKARIWPLLS